MYNTRTWTPVEPAASGGWVPQAVSSENAGTEWYTAQPQLMATRLVTPVPATANSSGVG